MLFLWLLFIASVLASSNCKTKDLGSPCDPECLVQNVRGFTCACDGPNILCYPSSHEPPNQFGTDACNLFNDIIVMTYNNVSYMLFYFIRCVKAYSAYELFEELVSKAWIKMNSN